MNHIYRRIWSKAKRCWVVASEITPGEGRKSRCVTVGVGQARSGFVLLAAVAACTAHAGPMGPCSDGSIDDLQCEFDGNEMLASSSSLASRWVFPMSAGTRAVGQWSTVFGDAADAPGRYSGAFGYGAKVQGDNSAAFGYTTNVSGEKSAAFGPRARIEGILSAAMGYGATAKGGHASAFGAAALADGVGTVAVGHDSRAYALNSIAIGSGSRTLASGGGSSIAIGGNSSAGSVGSIGAIAVGAETRASSDAVAIGYGAKAYATSSVALGIGSQTVDANTVSVGSASVKRRIVNVQPGSLISGSTDAVTGDQLYNTNQHVISVRTIANTAKTNADTALGKANLLEGLLSQASGSGNIRVGGGNSGNLIDVRNSAIANRKITGVADATLSTTSTDAVTGKQLNATNTKLGVVEKTADAAKVDVAAVRVIAQAAANRIDASILALGKGATAENGSYGISTALGNNAKAYNGRSVALGDDARAGVDADGNKVANQNAGVSIGAGTRSANGAVATGFRANASGNFSIAVGGDAKAEAEHATAVGNLSKASASQATALGRGSEATAQYASALGNLAKATKTGSVALGDRAQASHENAVALGAGAVTASANSVSVGSASRKRKIQYIADGVVGAGSTDAITGNQLHVTNQAVTKAQTAADGATTTANAAKVESGNALAETVALGGLVNQAAVNGSVRLGEKNSGTQLDVRNSANANRRIMGVADGAISATSNEAVTGKQLHETNANVNSAQTTASAAKDRADTALADTGVLKGLVGQAAANGNVRVGEKNSGTMLDIRNSANANRKLTGVADGAVSASSDEAINGRQLNATNEKVATVEGIARSAGTEAGVAKGDAAKALAETAVLGGLVAQVSASGNVRLGEKNSGTTLDVRNSANAERKISGVADGLLSASSAEAVSGKQLYSSNSRISVLEDASQFMSIGVAPTSERAEAGLAGVAVGNSAKTGSDGGTAVGTLAKALGRNSVTIGRASVVHEGSDSGFALGAGAEVGIAGGGARGGVAIGAGAKVGKGANGSLAIGEGSQANEAGVASFGSATTFRRLVNVARGTADHNATTVSQLKDSLATLGGGAGMDANGNIIAPTYTVQGGTQSTVEDALTALDGAVVTAGRRADKVEGQLSSIFQDSPSARADGTSQIALNGVNGMVLTNLADGRVAPGSRDAVTGNQLYAAEQKISQNRSDLEAMRKEREMGQQAMRGLDASIIDYGGARLTGVAEGKLSADSSDVVRGSQLYETNSRISELEGDAQFISIGSAPFSERAAAGVAGVAVGNSAKTGLEGGTAVGTFAEAMGKNSTAIGRAATVSVDSANGFAMGVGAQVGGGAGGANEGIAIGAGARVGSGAHGSLALGNGSQADEEGVASFGGVGIQRRLVNIARGTADHNATTVSQLNDSLATLGGGAGMDPNGNITAPAYTVQGGTQNNVEDALMALDGAVITAGRRADKVEGQLNSIFQDSPSARADGMSQIALNGVNGMVLTNLADGRVAPGSRDAVTGNQLYAAEQKISQNRNDLEAMRKEREMGQQTMRGLDANGPIDFGGARLTGVADGSISADSRDVVTGRQLFGVDDRVSKIENQRRFFKVDVDQQSQDAVAGFLGVAIGDSARTREEGGTAVGAFSSALARNSVALGRGSTVEEPAMEGFAVGVGARVSARNGIAIGTNSSIGINAAGSISIGASSEATESSTVSFGNSVNKRRLVNIANGTADHNAATVGQLRGALSTLGGEVDANGNIVGPRFNVQGQTQSTLNGALEALDGAVVANTSRVDKVETQLRSVFQGTPSVRADGVNQLTLAGANGMVIANVANGLIAAGSRDAVNGGQLHSMQQQLNGRMDGLEQRIDDAPAPRALASSSVPKPQAEESPVVPEGKDSQQVASVGERDKPTPQPKANKDDSPKPQVDTAELEKMLARANEYTDGAISNFERRLDKMDKRFNRMAAMSSAQSAMAMNTAGLATYNRLGAGVGYSEGESAMAVGYQRVLNEKGSATFSLNGAFTNSGERSMGVGVGIGW